MSWSFVQQAHAAQNQASGVGNAFGSNVTAGNAITAFVLHSYPGCAPTISDSQGNIWTKVVDRVSPTTLPYLSAWTTVASSTGANTVTVSFGCGNMSCAYFIEYSGLQTGPYDSNANANNVTTACTAGSLVTGAANDLVVSLFHSAISITYSSGSGTTRFAYSTNDIIQDQNTLVAGVVVPTIVASSASIPYPCMGWSVAFKQSGGGGAIIQSATQIQMGTGF